MSGPRGTDGPVHDLLGVGVGPFNLGLACLADPVPDLDVVFLEADDEFRWHPGMMLDDATLQVPFLADLVTMADPTSRWSFLNFLKQSDRLYPFYIRESFYPLRREFEEYCSWAADRLTSVRFGEAVEAVEWDDAAGCYLARTTSGGTYRGRRLVLGVGTSPRTPDCVEDAGGPAIHSSRYLAHHDELRTREVVTIVGSGQSAAEIYRDLLADSPHHDYELVWVTRSPRFFPMEYTKLTLELTSPEYSGYFQSLPPATRDRLLREQRSLYKGISGDLVDAISDLHYQLRVSGDGPRATLVTNTALTGAAWDGERYQLDLHHAETDESFGLSTDGLVMATGYGAQVPEFLDPVRDRLDLTRDEADPDAADRYVVSPTYTVQRPGLADGRGGEIFVQNAEEHTHGFVAPDLGMGAFRSSVIIGAVTGREIYPVEKRIAVQSFGVPEHLRGDS